MKASIKNRGAKVGREKKLTKKKEADHDCICLQSGWNGSSKGLVPISQMGTDGDEWLKYTIERPDVIFNTLYVIYST